MKHYLGYQKVGSNKLERVEIPMGYERQMDHVISQHKGIKIPKHNLDLTDEEIKGIFSEEEWQNMNIVFEQPVTTAKQAWLEMGEALRKRQSLDRWKTKKE